MRPYDRVVTVCGLFGGTLWIVGSVMGKHWTTHHQGVFLGVVLIAYTVARVLP